MPQTFDITAEPVGNTYRLLITACAEWSATVLMVSRDEKLLSDRARRLLAHLHPDLIDSSLQSEWPGTKLWEHKARVFRYRLTSAVLGALTGTVSHLYEWLEPDLPEDLCLLRRSGSPLLVTISHERDAFLELLGDERMALTAKVPLLALTPHTVRR